MQLNLPPTWHYATTPPTTAAVIRRQPEDFQVTEQLGFSATGSGEHVLLQVRKRDSNTEWVARQIARFAGVKNNAVSYAGLKDRHAIATQWFSVQLGNCPDPDWTQLDSEAFSVLQANRHQRKLRRGSLSSNDFQLCLRDIDSTQHSELEQHLAHVKTVGVPNYFGEQRFGHEYHNLVEAAALLEGSKSIKQRQQRSLYLSAVRSFLFNEVLSLRVQLGNWRQIINGDVMQLAGSNSVFVAEAVTEELQARVASGDIHPTAPLWGRGDSLAQYQAAALEQQALSPYVAWQTGLIREGLEQARRPLRLLVPDLHWQWLDTHSLQLCFSLPAGAYATTVLRELVNYSS